MDNHSGSYQLKSLASRIRGMHHALKGEKGHDPVFPGRLVCPIRSGSNQPMAPQAGRKVDVHTALMERQVDLLSDAFSPRRLQITHGRFEVTEP